VDRNMIASELVKVAKLLCALPMQFHDVSQINERENMMGLKMALGLQGGFKVLDQQTLVFQEGSSNKFHFFLLAQNPDGTYAAGNATGRIGYRPVARVIAVGDQATVTRKYRDHVAKKRAKGYQPVD
jgi:predicted DNA-binding WGR domain protein